MNSERELFLYELNGHGYGFQDTTWSTELGRFNDDVLNMTWEMWQASAQRQGYKLVPVDDLKHIRALNKDAGEADEKYLKEINSTLGRIINEMIEGNNE